MEKPAYFSVIPANVRYDKNLNANAKLLYGEITALSNKEGICWASNGYFAELYDVSKGTVSKWLSKLQKHGYISIKIKYKNGTKEIEKRSILINTPIDENVYTYRRKRLYPIDENVKENNTSINNININKEKYIKRKFEPPTLEEVKAYIEEKKYSVNADTFFNYFEVSNWVDSQGKPVKNWKQKIITWNTHSKAEVQEKREPPPKEEIPEDEILNAPCGE